MYSASQSHIDSSGRYAWVPWTNDPDLDGGDNKSTNRFALMQMPPLLSCSYASSALPEAPKESPHDCSSCSCSILVSPMVHMNLSSASNTTTTTTTSALIMESAENRHLLMDGNASKRMKPALALQHQWDPSQQGDLNQMSHHHTQITRTSTNHSNAGKRAVGGADLNHSSVSNGSLSYLMSKRARSDMTMTVPAIPTRRRCPVTAIRKAHEQKITVEWKSIPGFWHALIDAKLRELTVRNADEEEIVPIPDQSLWLSTSEVSRQFKLRVNDDLLNRVAFFFAHDKGEFFWEPSGVRAQALQMARNKQVHVLEAFAERMAKMDYLLKENGVMDFERLFLRSPLSREACEDFAEICIARPRISQLAVLKNLIGLSEMSAVFPPKYCKPSVLRQYVTENVFVVDRDGLLIDKRIRTREHAVRFIVNHLDRSRLVVKGLVAAAVPIGEMLGDPSALIKALENDEDVASALGMVRSRSAVERLVLARVARRLRLADRESVQRLVKEKQVDKGVKGLIDLACASPCSKHVGIDSATREIEFLLQSTMEKRTQVLMDFLNDAFDNVDEEPDALFERLPFLKEYALGTFGGSLLECEACVPIAMSLIEMDSYETCFESFRANLRGKVGRGYTWQRAVKSVMGMKLARGVPFTLADIYASL